MLHVLKRLLLIVVAYLIAVLIGLVSIVIIYIILSSIPGAPPYFSTVSLSPLVVLMVPTLAFLLLYIIVILTSLPSLAVALISELFSLQQVWLFGLLGAAISAGAFVYASPQFVGTIDGTDWADLGIVALGGACAGSTYWLIAGRNAGFAHPLPSPAVG
jgi:hypothetical protein